ncbi:MAG: type II toxin-antitoxin system Phd/YefM family antitoxin [Lachnospiraceae bacterium]|nr:type II toxin-antitoxin system Phd/YefM family antitoxin [Lachnospiraceae bacterium]
MIVKQAELRSNLKKYFDLAYDGDTVIVPRRENKNVIIISEREYNDLKRESRMMAYGSRLTSASSTEDPVPSNASYTATTDLRTDNMHRLDVFASFKQGWNGNSAAPLDRKVIEKVREILIHQEIQPEIFPSATGTIEFEYSNSRRDFMGIEIGAGTKAEVFIVFYNGHEITENIDADSTSINERVKRFYE